MPDHTDDAQQPSPPRRTTALPPLFTPRVTRSNTPVRESTATRERRSSRLFTPPGLARQAPLAVAPSAAPPLPVAPPPLPEVPPSPPAAPFGPPIAETPAVPQGALEGRAPSPAAEPSSELGEIETADIALEAWSDAGLAAEEDAPAPRPEAATAHAADEPDAPGPRVSIEGVEIDRPVWTFTPNGVPLVPPAGAAPPLDELERSPDDVSWSGPSGDAGVVSPDEGLDVEHGANDAGVRAEPDAAPLEHAPPSDVWEEEPLAAAEAEVTPAVAPEASARPAEGEDEVDEAWATATRPDGEPAAAGGAVDVEPRDASVPSELVPGGPSAKPLFAPADASGADREIDEMTEALGWAETLAGADVSAADVESALAALDPELHASAAPFAAASGTSQADGVATALERIARRIREGQVALPRDAAASTEESALAVTLAALLKGPPRA